MTKIIVCEECSKSLGELRDGTLRKYIVHLCNSCNQSRLSLKKEVSSLKLQLEAARPQYDYEKMIEDVLKGKF